MFHDSKKKLHGAVVDEMGVDVIGSGFPDCIQRRFRGCRAYFRTIKMPLWPDRCAIKKRHRGLHRLFLLPSSAYSRLFHVALEIQNSKCRRGRWDAAVESVSLHAILPMMEWFYRRWQSHRRRFLMSMCRSQLRRCYHHQYSDTVGCAMPDDYAAKVYHAAPSCSHIDHAILSVHCHNDLGLVVILWRVLPERVRSNVRLTGLASGAGMRRWKKL